MGPSRLTSLLFTVVFLVISLASLGRVGNSSQGGDKSLDIERYPNEPLELVDIKINEKSVRNDVKRKMRENISKWGLDSVTFDEKEGWFKQIKITMRNVSGQSIYGLKAGLNFQYPGLKILFALPLVWRRDLKQSPLKPGDEIIFEVDDQLFDRAMKRMIPYGADANRSTVSFSLDDAYFNEDFKWSRGQFMRRDPNNRYKWDVIDQIDSSGASPLEKPAGFTLIGFRMPAVPQSQNC
jgi:hypothetical protein